MSVTTRSPDRGMAFEIDDLVRARQWAERQGMVLRIRLDHVERGQDLEEVLTLAPLGRGLWRLSMWRDRSGVVARQGSQPPALFHTIEAALAAATPRRRMRIWSRARPF